MAVARNGARRMFETARKLLARYPYYLACTTLYWLWTGLVFQGPAFYMSQNAMLPIDVPSWWVPMVLYALSYCAIGLSFRRMQHVARTDIWPALVAVAMALGVIACIVWLYVPIPSPGAGAALYCAGTLLVSLGAACFLSIGSRFNGYVGPHGTLVVSIAGALVAAAVMAVLALLPRIVCHVFLLAVPALYAACAVRMYRAVPRGRLFDYDVDRVFAKPKKLLATSMLHGMPFGLALVLLSNSRGEETILFFNATCFALGGILLLAVMALKGLDFSQLIYLAGFPLMGFGLLLVALFDGDPLVGCAFLTVGYAFVHFAMCGVNAYLVKQFGIPMPWILSWTTCCFMLGQAAGALVGTCSLSLGAEAAPVATCILFVVLVASIFMVDNRNMQYGWGVVKPSATDVRSHPFSAACRLLGTEFDLTERESDILELLALGRSRKAMGKELSITEETVKSHVRSVYAKLGTHTKDELIELVQRRAADLDG